MKISDLLTGTAILETTHSKYNGKIDVIRDLSWGTYIKVGGLTQSGGILTGIWKQTLKKVLIIKPRLKNCLILGLGGGTAAKLVAQYWVGARITGVDIDKKIVDLGIKYLGLDTTNLNVVIQDADKYFQITNNLFDLILVDLYSGDEFPEKFQKEEFLLNVKKKLSESGIAIFNRLYGTNHRKESLKFGQKLEKIFEKVDYTYPQANIMFTCYAHS